MLWLFNHWTACFAFSCVVVKDSLKADRGLMESLSSVSANWRSISSERFMRFCSCSCLAAKSYPLRRSMSFSLSLDWLNTAIPA